MTVSYIIEGVKEAFILLFSMDYEIYSIIIRTLIMSIASVIISGVIGIPLGLYLGLKKFKGKRAVARLIYTFMGTPPVVAGLFVALFISRRGALGSLELMFTIRGMIIAQVVLITPIVIGVVFNHTKEGGMQVLKTCRTLGAGRWYTFLYLVNDMRIGIFIALVSGFARGISEVGAVMIVGGNILGHTRVMTTFIAMNNSMGNYSKSIAMGMVLFAISFVVNSILYGYVEVE